MQRPAHPTLPASRDTNSRGILALAIVVTGWLIFAWALADYDTPLPNGGARNRSAEQLSVLFMGFLATLFAGLGAAAPPREIGRAHV